jgi:predicted RNA-binding Zn-ribbon protein involved in translation (DUF1610 family)
MTSSGSFTCPACGSEFEVQERLAEAREPASAASEEPVAEERPHDEGVSFQCPACGADYDTQETLPEEAEARH